MSETPVVVHLIVQAEDAEEAIGRIRDAPREHAELERDAFSDFVCRSDWRLLGFRRWDDVRAPTEIAVWRTSTASGSCGRGWDVARRRGPRRKRDAVVRGMLSGGVGDLAALDRELAGGRRGRIHRRTGPGKGVNLHRVLCPAAARRPQGVLSRG